MAEDKEIISKGGRCASAFPAGLRVLVVDDDETCLLVIERLLRACHYQVTRCQQANHALTLLREGEGNFDIVLSEIKMPGMDGFQLLQTIGSEMDLPVVMMSNYNCKELVMKVIAMGACDFLVKPVRKEQISVIWQHVVRRQKNGLNKSFTRSSNSKPIGEEYQNGTSPEENCGSSNHEKNDQEEADQDGYNYRNDIVSVKKSRMVWTTELHDQFVAAVNHVGLKNAVPKKILELMRVPGLTRENVASHLQKYRIYLRRKSENRGVGNKLMMSSPAAVHYPNILHVPAAPPDHKPTTAGGASMVLSTCNLQPPNNNNNNYTISNLSSQISSVGLRRLKKVDVAGALPLIHKGGSNWNQRITTDSALQYSWCYGRLANSPHATSPTVIDPEQESYSMGDQGLNYYAAYNYNCPPLLSTTHHVADIEAIRATPSFGNSRNSEYTLCSANEPFFLVEPYNVHEDVTATRSNYYN